MAETFTMVAEQRRTLAGLLDQLNDEEWATPSLCAGWTVRDVAGHLTMPFNVSKPAFVMRILKAGGNYNKMADRYAREAAVAPPSTLVAALRANAESHFTPPGLGPEAPLTDVIVHGLDIGIPVGHEPPAPAEAMDNVLSFLTSPKAVRGFGPKGLTTSLRFESTDTGWAVGTGPLVAGPAASLVLALSGRRIGLEGLGGEGIGELTRRLS